MKISKYVNKIMIKQYQLSDLELRGLYEQDKNVAYFAELYKQHYSKIYNYSLQRNKNQEIAKEITTTYFVNMAQKLTCLTQPKQFVDWLSNNFQEACHHSDDAPDVFTTTF